MHRLKGHLVYLCGPMDNVPDLGADWRRDIQQFLWSLDIGVLNPTDKPTDTAKEDKNTVSDINSLKDKGLYDQVSARMKPIVNIDLGMVDLSNFIIMNIDRDYHMCGSYGEQTHACIQRKPVIVRCKQGKKNVPNWLFGIANHNLFFDTWNDVRGYIKSVDQNILVDETNHKWQFFNFDKIFNR